MMLTVHTRRETAGVSGNLKADRRLYTNRDRTRLVEAGEPDAAFLLAAPGRPIDPADVQALGLSMDDGGRVIQGGRKEAPKPDDKARAKTEDKSFARKWKK